MKNLLSLLLLSTSLFVGTSVAQLVIVTPPQVVLAKGQKMQLQAYLYQNSGAAEVVTNKSLWTSVEPSVATVSKTGLVTMKATGSALIIANYRQILGYGTVWNQTTPFISVPPSNTSFGNIEHVIFIVKENRSFDEYFRTFPGANGATTATLSTG